MEQKALEINERSPRLHSQPRDDMHYTIPVQQCDKLEFVGGEKVLKYMRIEAGQGHAKGRELLEKMYLETFGKEMPEILTEAGGKPYFADGSAHFSISHTKKHVFCALSDRPVGLDAEETDRKVDLRLAEKILSPGEKLRYDQAPDKQAALLKLWVLKEAAAKLTGIGIRGYPNKTDFSTDDPRITEIDGCYVAVVEF